MAARVARNIRVLAMATGVATADSVLAQDISLNYESLSSMEEPLATQVGDMTLVLTGLLDTRLTIDGEDNRDSSEPGLIGNFQLSSLAQLPNRWRVGLAYFDRGRAARRISPCRRDRAVSRPRLGGSRRPGAGRGTRDVV